MRNKLSKQDYILLTLAIFGILLFIFFYQQIFPKAGIHLDLPQKQIENIAYQIVKELGYNISGYRKIINFNQDPAQIKYLVRQYGTKEAIALMKEQIPAYYWTISWKTPKDLLKKLTSSKDEEVTINVSSGEAKQKLGDFKIMLSTKGKILSFKVNIEKKAKKDSISKAEAFKIAEALLKKIEGKESGKYEFKTHIGDTTHIFKWSSVESLLGEEVEIQIETYRSRVVKYEKLFNLPEEVSTASENTNFIEIPSVLVFFLFFVSIIIILVQKLRRDEISIKSGISLSILVGLAMIISLLYSSYQNTFLEILIPVLIVPPFIFFILLTLIGVSESLGREVWPEKLATFAAFNRIKILFPQFSKNIIRGICLAFLSLGILTILLKIFNLFFNFYFLIEDKQITKYVLLLPFLYALSSSLINSSFSEFIFRLFSISYLRKKLSNTFWIIVISAFVWAFNFIGDSKTIVVPVYLHILENFLIGIVFAYFFIRYDLMTVLIGSVFFNMIRKTFPLLFWGNTFLMWNGILFWVFIGLLIIIAVIGFNKEIDQKQLSQYVPPYVIRMQERERQKRELEIARRVQLSFLPKHLPQISGIDMATVCIPATEVGGDYYDFIELGKGKLGVVIGDVSGKGISAAFHMTLTKGLLKSQAKEGQSPREVLTRLNELFYENVERGTFISMIYSIFDLAQKTLTFARAGHNPLIIRSSKSYDIELLCPKGIALGLEKGDLFSQIIEEQKVRIYADDIFIFYTDGVSEAMNNDKMEFGEKRLETIVKDNSHVLANELTKIIQKKITEFVGNTPQHDDMTMIIVKIL